MSIFALGEPLFLTDLVGASLIIGFQFWNITNPVGSGHVGHSNENHKEKLMNNIRKEENVENIYIEIDKTINDK